MDAEGRLVTSPGGVTLTFEAVADPDGSINSTVLGKSNFWEYVGAAYGVALPLEWGLAGTRMPGPQNISQPMAWNPVFRWFEAEGIPIIPIDDAGHANPYPLLRIVARDGEGTELAYTDVVVPVSSEMDCRACHAFGSESAAMPSAGWVFDENDKRDYRLNILLLHDEVNGTGLYDSVELNNSPVLCASCHLSEALPGTGIEGIPPLTPASSATPAAPPIIMARSATQVPSKRMVAACGGEFTICDKS